MAQFVATEVAGPPLNRSGNVTVAGSTWNISTTDNDLTQTPLRSPTVFNFFLPEYRFPGILASAGMTTPEFQLTSDTEVILQLNFLQGGILGNGSNTNGLTSFNNGNGSITLDIAGGERPAPLVGSGAALDEARRRRHARVEDGMTCPR
jgi:hypothetical protein